MPKILVATDDSATALRAVAHAIKKVQWHKDAVELHLVNVQAPMHGGVNTFVDAAQLKQLHQEEGAKALASAKSLLQRAGISHHEHIFVGDAAEMIARHANEHAYDELVLGTRGQNPVASLLLGSVSSKLLQLADMPVVMVK
jgi:nucleotide-binding universal stress UspA family protein